jgi:hypothetical protein
MSEEPGRRPAVVVMARAPRPGEAKRALEPLLGPEGCAALQTALITAAVRWAQALAPASLYVAYDPPDAAPEMRALVSPDAVPSEAVPPDAVLFPQHGDGIGPRLADASARVFADHAGPLLVVWPDLPRLRPGHATAALGDLQAGCDIALGPVLDGGYYLIAIDRPQPELFALPERAWRATDVMGVALEAMAATGLEVGILRAERGLHSPADLRAARADPTLPPELAGIIGGRAA